MEVWIASSNPGKIIEFRSLCSQSEKSFINLFDQRDISGYLSPQETGDSFEANARIKVQALRQMKQGVWVLADDSGLEVDALDSLPGIHSARYAGELATDLQNREKLLQEIHRRGLKNPKAQFRCVIVADSPMGQEYVVEGVLKGCLIAEERGGHGFGYDSLFLPQGRGQTLAEMELSQKNRISHRNIAFNQWLQLL